MPWADTVTTAYFGAEGINDIRNGNITPETVLELAPLTRVGKNVYKGIGEGIDNIERRGIETFMRTTPVYDPVPESKDGIAIMLKGLNGGKKRLAHIADYVLTGHRVGPKGYYNSFAGFEPYSEADFVKNPSLTQRWNRFTHPEGLSRAYSGFVSGTNSIPIMQERNDLIDAFLYRKDIDPFFGMKKIATGNNFGVHDSYIAQNYPQKAKDIPVYQTTSLNKYPDKDVMTNGIWEGAENGLFKMGNGTDYVNAAGHQYTTGESIDGIPLVKQQDIWKFNQDYLDKWLKKERINSGIKPYSPLKLSAYKYALKEINRLGTPIITRTEWIPEKEAIMSTK